MATAFTHAFLGATLGRSLGRAERQPQIFVGLALAAALPDLDVLAFHWDIPYHHALGHRGFSHSFLFAALVAPLLANLLVKSVPAPERTPSTVLRLSFLAFLAVASHGLLDALTDAGLGVGFFIPFSLDRFFFPWRPLITPAISPLAFFSARSFPILIREGLLVWLSALGFWAGLGWWRSRTGR